jgi:hypothetical protein
MNRYFKTSAVMAGLLLAACSSDTEYRYVTSSLPALNNASLETEGGKNLDVYAAAIVYDAGGTPVTFDKSQVEADTADKLVLKNTATGETTAEATVDLTDLDLGSINVPGAADLDATTAKNNALVALETAVETAYNDAVEAAVTDKTLVMNTNDVKVDSGTTEAAKEFIDGLIEKYPGAEAILADYDFIDEGTKYVYNGVGTASDELEAVLEALQADLAIGGSENATYASIDELMSGFTVTYETTRTDNEARLVMGKGLQYATFGYVKQYDNVYAGDEGTPDTVTVDTFAGAGVPGIEASTLNGNYAVGSEDIAFKGKTVANLTVDTANTDLTGTATLTFKTGGTETLDLSFNDWYDVNYSDGTHATLAWKDGVAEDFVLTDRTTAEDFDGEGETLTVDSASFEATYYGNGKTVSEAAGIFSASDTGNVSSEGYKLEGAFGGTATAPIPLK